MSDPITTDSDTEVDSNSSWTLLAEESLNKTENDDKTKDVPMEIIETPLDNTEIFNPKVWHDNIDVESISSTSSIESVHTISQHKVIEEPVQGCIPFHDFLNLQEVGKEDEFDDQISHWEQIVEKTKSRKKKYKKFRTEVSTAKVVGAVLSLAGISFVCMMAPYMTRQFLTSDFENKLEKNFTKVDSYYARSHGFQVYVDKSDEAKTVCRKPETLEAFVKQCCLTHINSKGKSTKRCARCSRDQPALQKILNGAGKGIKKELEEKRDKPSCLDENLNENKLEKRINLKSTPETDVIEVIDLTKDDDSSTEVCKSEEPRKDINTKKKLTKKNVNISKSKEINVILPQESIKSVDEKCHKTDLNNNDLKLKKKLIKKCSDNLKELHPSNQESTKAVKPKSKLMLQSPLKEPKKVTKKVKTITNLKKEPKGINDKKCAIKKTESPPTNNQPKNNLAFSKLQTVEIQPSPNINKQFPDKVFRPYSLSQLKPEIVECSSNIEDVSKINTEQPQIPTPSNFRCDYMACQLLQDIALLKITGKMKTVAQKRQKKLKKRIEKRKLKLMKGSGGETDSEEEKKTRKPLKPSTTQKMSFLTTENNKKRYEINLSKDNDLFLKELPFGKKLVEQTLPDIVIDDPKVKMHEKESVDDKGVKSLVSLIELSKLQKDRLKQLEQMKNENQMKIEALIKDRKYHQKKDACLGYYNVPMPEYKKVSEQLQKLKCKPSNHVGFVCDSSDSESEKNCSFKSIENRVSAELMAALKVGKKVSDSFKEWTLKKAPTLTCLKKFCNDKVTHISEKLSKPSSSDYQYLAMQERHEKLVNYWNSKKEYFDKRIEICNLLKDKISTTASMGEMDDEQNSVSHGVHILDTIIADVLKTVKSSNNLGEQHPDIAEIEAKRACQSVCNINKSMNVIRRSKADLYRWLFDGNGMMIKKRDTNNFATTIRENLLSQNNREISKQDPSKSFHERVLKKHN